ncbi:MAG: hypothetical protein M3384_18830 [Acidobacteriota bacterium]|nr:hypothetical protein [Acidobacteriota bacterium]
MNVQRVFSKDNIRKYSLFLFPLLVFAIYAALPTRDFYWDALIYSQFIEDSPRFGAHLLHPNHLFYNVLGYLAFHAAQNLGFETRAIYVLQLVTIVFSALSALVFFKIARQAFQSEYLSFWLAALFAFGAAWWRFSIDADVYPISVFFLLVSFYFLLPGKRPRPFLIAITHSFAMFFHELAVLFFPVAALGLIFQTVSAERKRRISIVLQYALAAFLLTFGTYCLSFYLVAGAFDVKAFIAWTTSFAPDSEISWNAWRSLTLTLRGHRQMFFDGSSRLFDRNALTVVLLIAFFASALFFAFVFLKNLKEIKIWRRAVAERKIYREPLFLLALAWIIPYLLFLFFFIPQNTFYRLFYFPAVILLIALVLAPFENSGDDGGAKKRRWRLAALVAALCLYNFLFYIYPNARVRENTPLALAFEANRVWSEKKAIVFHVPNRAAFDLLDTNNRLVKYFNPATGWKPLNFTTLEEFESEIRALEAGGAAIWLDAAAADELAANPQAAAWLANNSRAARELSLPAHRMKYVQITPNPPK